MITKTLNSFFEKIKKDRHQLMVRKGYIENTVKYSDDLWKSFRDVWLSKPDI